MIKWLKNKFILWINKDKYKVNDVHQMLDNLLGFIDVNKNGYISIKELYNYFKDIVKNLRGLKNEKK